ncbi:hypothetical protein vBVpaMR16F_205 [Vibrio phage vB_VpaM_R16F]|nr:hypothetical protein vBVpaMR16F_205 [Vibrio phage vB_VpaM_R16F]
MSIKEQVGEIVDSLINKERVDVDIYDINVNGEDFSGEAFIDSDGDLRAETKIDIIDIEKLWSQDEILDYFTEEDLRNYLESVYG